ncbi:hypothetical protein ACFR9U_17205 [Halorientalis brevis]|uniref:Uncharacterized protein n=1 Tax=Halorientalis brevis TaxID=1126241 RepID=A0ABD6CFT4_9EURY|nr:hypothetical protein [Halorientalis brevis]
MPVNSGFGWEPPYPPGDKVSWIQDHSASELLFWVDKPGGHLMIDSGWSTVSKETGGRWSSIQEIREDARIKNPSQFDSFEALQEALRQLEQQEQARSSGGGSQSPDSTPDGRTSGQTPTQQQPASGGQTSNQQQEAPAINQTHMIAAAVAIGVVIAARRSN